MSSLMTRLRTFAALGPMNGLRVLRYRFALRLGVHPVQWIRARVPEGDFFATPVNAPIAAATPTTWREEALLFGAHRVSLGAGPPAWTVDPLRDGKCSDPPPESLAPWWRIGDFDAGDIKRVWEYSRFDWAIAFAQQARNGEPGAFDRLNCWIADWATRNPPYSGPNWKCAQEASIRLMHLWLAAAVLDQERTMESPLCALIDAHVRRIVPTLSYAHAQDNNHATSEAAALFVAGAWLGMAGQAGGEALARRGRALLERHVGRLFEKDGSFSQYSLNYHRVALDTLSIVEVCRRRAGLPPFSARLRQRAAAAADWLRVLVDPETGDAPNLGANDGANLLPLTDAPYRDHRPSVQLATLLFRDARAFASGPWDDAHHWLGVEAPSDVLTLPAAAVFDDGGYAVLRAGPAMAMLRYPRYRFRPSQADALHVDLWLHGQNLLRDAGSYSYNTDPALIDYFGGVQSHNTVQFDDQPQMPRISRFLLGDWLKTETCGLLKTPPAEGFHAAYRHRAGWTHAREIRLGTQLRVTDRIEGFKRHATLRWRLAPGDWRLEGATATNGRDRLTIEADVPLASIALTEGSESRHYLRKTTLPVLEVTVEQSARIVSEYSWTS